MLFAAGMGTRLKPLTDTMPKALVPIAGQALLWHVLMKLKKAGFDRIVINVHHFAQQIIDYLHANRNFGLDIRISDEREQLLETGGGLKKALPLFAPEYPILIHNVDILSNVDLPAFYCDAVESGADALLLISQRKTKRYLLFDDEHILHGWTNIDTGEVRSPYPGLDPFCLHRLAFSGIHVLSPRVFPLFSEMPERFGIIDFYLKYCHQRAFIGIEQENVKLIDVGKLNTLSEAEQFIKQL